jgi:hypothetical protein
MDVDCETVPKSKKRPSRSSSESSPDFDLSDPDTGYIWDQSEVVKFSSVLGRESPSPETQSELNNPPYTTYTTTPLIPSRPLSTLNDNLVSPETPTFDSYATSLASSQFYSGSTHPQSPPLSASFSETLPSPHVPQMQMHCVPRPISPRPGEAPSVQYYLQYHRECITQYHYFMYSDYGKLCSEVLFAMAEKSTALRHAIVSFSTLIYSIQREPTALHFTFQYYEKAVQELRSFLVKDPQEMDRSEADTAIATALLLTTWEVHSHIKVDIAIFRGWSQKFSTLERRSSIICHDFEPCANQFDGNWTRSSRVVRLQRGCKLFGWRI